MAKPDWRPTKRIKDPTVMRRLHLAGVVCVVCGERNGSLHHILPRSRGGDDLASNLVGLCGSGTTGCHGLIEDNHVGARILLGQYLMDERPDFMFYIQGKLGEEEGRDWLRRRFFVDV